MKCIIFPCHHLAKVKNKIKKIIIRRIRIKYYILKSKVSLNSSNRAFIFKIHFSKTVCLFSRPNAGFQRSDVMHEMIYLEKSSLDLEKRCKQWSADCKLEVYPFYLGLTLNQALRSGTLRRGGGENLENCAYLWKNHPGQFEEQ